MPDTRLLLGDCIEAMRTLDAESVHAIVTDPPYGINFMGKAWDGKAIEEAAQRPIKLDNTYRLTGGADDPNRKVIRRTGSGFNNRAGVAGSYDFTLTGNRAFQEWCAAWATECLRILKPGGHMLVFGGTRTYHRLAAGIEDAGFEIRDCLAWMYGTGFPKALNVSKAIDAHFGAERTELVGHKQSGLDAPGGGVFIRKDGVSSTFARSRDETGLIPIHAPATPEAAQWDGWATGLKPGFEPIVMARKPMKGTVAATVLEYGTSALNIDACRLALADEGEDARLGGSGVWGTDKMAKNVYEGGYAGIPVTSSEVGRWPANVLLDEDAAQFLDEHSGNELVGASRFYYVPKASRAERNAGIDSSTNVHPTVKPIDLMRWVVRLVTPPGGTVLDPFMGSGTTPIATLLEGFNGVGIEREAEYMEIARLRLKFWQEHGDDGLRIVREQEASEARREAVAAAGQLSLL